ncbi:hypothetical protein NIIDMKKI_39140 [Mycobacterium kansasii]|uniref:Uncharacterized protein n=1 Tax=Mycobacterium kansasii TaxID=1768 RepID=A0A7G1IJ90_MYCKA|nr:hypothetical protein NIIDMKKI_39140 [Mycobacterium kansasii]
MRNAGENEFGSTPGSLGKHREDGCPPGQPDVFAALLYRGHDLIGNHLAGDVDHEVHPVKAAEGISGRRVILGMGQQVGGDRPEFDEGGADRQAAKVGS